MKSREQYFNLLTTACIFSVFILFFSIFTMFIPQAYTEEPKTLPPGNTVRTSIFTIGEIAVKYNIIFVGERRFRVTPTTTILDYQGQNIPLNLIPVPSKAEITYRLLGYNKEPLVDRIRLK